MHAVTATRRSTTTVDVLVVGSGGGGMTAALAADAFGLDTLVVEKSPQFGGSTALSGGGIWVPGAPSQRDAGYVPDPDGVFDYLQADHRRTGQRRAAARSTSTPRPEMMEFLEKRSPWFEFVWKPGYADYYPELPGGSELRQHHQRARDRPAQARRRGAEPADAAGAGAQGNLVRAQGSSAVLPGPAELARQGRAGEADLADVPGAGVRRPDGRDRPVAGGPDAAGAQGAGHPAVAELADDRADHRRRRHGDRRGRSSGTARQQRIGARHGVILATGGFDHDMAVAQASICPCSRRTGASAIPPRWATASGRGRRSAAPPTCSTRRGGSPRCAGPTAGCSSCSTSG